MGHAPIAPAGPSSGSSTPSPSKPSQAASQTASRPMTPGLAADAEDVAPKDLPEEADQEAAADARGADAPGTASSSLADALTDIGSQFKGLAGAEAVRLQQLASRADQLSVACTCAALNGSTGQPCMNMS